MTTLKPPRRQFLKLPLGAVAATGLVSTAALAAAVIDEYDPSNTKLCRRLRADISDDDLLFLKQIGLRWARVNFRPPVDLDFIASTQKRCPLCLSRAGRAVGQART